MALFRVEMRVRNRSHPSKVRGCEIKNCITKYLKKEKNTSYKSMQNKDFGFGGYA